MSISQKGLVIGLFRFHHVDKMERNNYKIEQKFGDFYLDCSYYQIILCCGVTLEFI